MRSKPFRVVEINPPWVDRGLISSGALAREVMQVEGGKRQVDASETSETLSALRAILCERYTLAQIGEWIGTADEGQRAKVRVLAAKAQRERDRTEDAAFKRAMREHASALPRITTKLVGALLALLVLASNADAGQGIALLFKGSMSSTDAPLAADSRSFIVLGDGTGPSKAKAIRAECPSCPLSLYVKAGGVRASDAEWFAAQPYLWRSTSGAVFTQGQYGWSYADLQRYAHEWAKAVVIPHIRATLAQVPVGTYDWIMVDNAVAQHPSLFVPSKPSDYDDQRYHDASLAVLLDVRAAFPSMRLLVNGWQGWERIGLRGEALGSSNPNYCDGVWFEGLRYKAGGGTQTDDRFIQDQGALLALNAAGKLVVWDEPGASSLGLRQAFGMFVSTGSVAANPSTMLFNLNGPPWSDWWR